MLAYAEDEDKTVHPINENERVLLVTGINCSAETAAVEMEAVQKRFSKTTGIAAYQSFRTGEVTPETAHEIGTKLAKEMREAWRKIDRITAQTTLIGKNLNTVEDVKAFIGRTEAEMETVSYARDKVRNRLRNCKDYPLTAEHKAHRADVGDRP